MDKINLLVIAPVLIVFATLVLAMFLLLVKTEHQLSNQLFAVFLILTAIDTSGVLFSLFADGPSNLRMLSNLMAFLQLPIFYLYVFSVCYIDFELKAKHLLHVLPFVGVNLMFLPSFYLVDIEGKLNFLENSKDMIEIQFSHIFIHVQILCYIIVVFLLIRRARRQYLENYAGASLKSFNWLFELAIAISIFYTLAFLKNVFKFSAYPNISEWLMIGLFLFELLMVTWYLFKALSHPNLFRKINSQLKLVREIISEEKEKPNLIEMKESFQEDIARLRKYMDEAQPFLNSSITIQNISDDIQLPVRDLSLLINHQIGQHFFDFINTYRIEYAKNILSDSTKKKVTILEILYEAGFNSKSSFNTAFKKQTGQTPSLYRKSFKNSDL